jgi:F-type H+-transporting ATPase subunit epsilon
MADTMQFDLVSPERRLASHPATSVQIPGVEGDMTAMPNHAPVITTLRPGIVSVDGPEGAAHYAVTGGFVEITPEGTTVLAERAYPRHADHRESIAAHLEEARMSAADAASDHKDGAEKFVADMVALLDAME